ncbi:LysE/ArgO family amino acid transporter [Paenibacillus sp. GCM10023252]|uniref:LysE/ArgO family amino acid transporter n=1 Tax=Paenibacillus sp. GCM10023252 TaxID=3252649 RepID=UPI0036155796
MLLIIIHGLILGFGLILPLGVQNVFVFNTGATQPSYRRALPVILTASLCDTVLILFAVMGLSLVVLNFTWLQSILYGAGCLFLLYMGWVLWKSKPSTGEESHSADPRRQVLFTASISLLNPHAILDTVGVIGTNSLSYDGSEKWIYTLTLVFVSWVWFFGLAFAGRQVGKRYAAGIFLARMNKVSACIIWGVALYMGSHFL